MVGVVALGAACRALSELGMDAVAEHERVLGARLRDGLDSVPRLERLELWPGETVDRVGVAAFALEGYRHPHLPAVLRAEHAIGVRHGCFCAHPLITHLLGITARRSTGSAPSSRPADDRRCPAQCGPASASGPPPRTSTCSSARSGR